MYVFMQEEDSGSSKECVYYSFLLSAILEVLYIKLASYFVNVHIDVLLYSTHIYVYI